MMKKTQVFIGFLLALVVAVSSCVKDPEPSGGDTTSRSLTATSLRFNITRLKNGVPEVQVGLSASREDRDNGFFMDVKSTNEEGWVRFDWVVPGRYFYAVRENSTGTPQIRIGEYTLGPDRKGVVNVRF